MSGISLVRSVEGEAGPVDIRFRPAAIPKRADILFVHGAWCASWCWEPFFLPWFAQAGYDCAAINLRGHGRSGGSLRGASIAGYLADMRAVAETMDDPFIVGHSMGGFLALHYAREYRVRGIALMASVPPEGAWGTLWRMLRERPFLALKCLALLDFRHASADRDYARRLLFSREIGRSDKDHYLKNLGSQSVRAFLEMLLRPVRGGLPDDTPRAVFGAECDSTIALKEVRQAAAFCGVAERILPNTSHMMMVDDRWREAAEALEEWFSGCLVQSTGAKATRRGR